MTSEQCRPDHSPRRIVLLLALAFVALGLRLHGIAAESFWFDETLSVRCSNGSVARAIALNGREMRPPLYYVGLRVWRTVFRDSDARIRAYSTVWSLIGILAVFLLARDIGGRNAAAIALALGALNPLDVWFAQEARNYSQTAALCLLGAWCLWRWISLSGQGKMQRGWRPWAVGYAVCAAAALLTHYLAVLVLVAQGLFALAVFGRRRCREGVVGYAAVTAAAILGFLPWLLYVQGMRGRFVVSHPEWMGIPDATEYISFLGREFFWGNVWVVHDRWWIPTMLLPGAVIVVCLWRLAGRRVNEESSSLRPQSLGVAYALWLLMIPVILAAMSSAVWHPVYYRLRFSQLVVGPFLILAGVACCSLRNRTATWTTATVLCLAMLTGTIVQHRTIQKTDWRSFAALWREKGPPSNAVFFPWFLKEAAGYYLERPVDSAAKEDLEKNLAQLKGREIWICGLQGQPRGAAQEEVDYREWLRGLGGVRTIAAPYNLAVAAVTIGEFPVPPQYRGRFDRWWEPIDSKGHIEGFGNRELFDGLETQAGGGAAFRWSRPVAWFRIRGIGRGGTVTLRIQLPPAVSQDYRPDVRFHITNSDKPTALFDSAPVATVGAYRPGVFEVELAVAPGRGDFWIGWKMNGVNLAQANLSKDDRDLGLQVGGIGLRFHRD